MTSTRRRLIGGMVAALAIAAGVLVAPMSAEASVSVPDAVARILADTNALRAAGGLAPLVENAAMDTVAQNWSAQMYANGAMTHNPNYSTQIPSGWTSAGENIATGFSYTTVVEAWHQSAGHYANIMGSYNAIGIGYYELNGQIYYTQDFAYYPSAPAPAPAPATTPAPEPTPTPTPTVSSPPPAPVVSVAAPHAAAPSRPMRCVRWSHHHCTKYQVIKKKAAKKTVRRRPR